MSGPFDRKYTPDQCEAAALEYIANGNGKRVSRMAAAGELRLHGEPVGAFTMPPSTVASYARKVRLRQAGKAAPAVATMGHRDAVENLRVRFLVVAHEELQAEERKKPGTRNLERIRQAERCALEAARLPAPTEPRPPSDGTRDANGVQASRSNGGKAGALLREHRATQTAPDVQAHSTASGDSSDAHDSHRSNEEQQRGGPGAPAPMREAAPAVLS